MFGYSNPKHYKRKSNELKSDLNKECLTCLVMSVCPKLLKTGRKKLYFMLKVDFKKHQIKIGRDKLFDFLRDEYCSVPAVRRYYRTTNSIH